MTYNQKAIKAELRRIDICDLLIACTVLEQETDAKKWGDLHDKLSNILADFDDKHIDEWAQTKTTHRAGAVNLRQKGDRDEVVCRNVPTVI